MRGLTSDDRIEELMHELETMSWDFMSINETMRTNRTEIWTTRGGHVFMTHLRIILLHIALIGDLNMQGIIDIGFFLMEMIITLLVRDGL